ncbi:unnamed protein product [Phytophthora fragariaefolia]|uniref:Unnamed protein product n=1 Tax=Phytophthora fragariaefolia TaxID=1490495 RepID=A0A9W6XB76_9STRA|nr:unnamed protein product [Phytophthora fragariaefolia]
MLIRTGEGDLAIHMLRCDDATADWTVESIGASCPDCEPEQQYLQHRADDGGRGGRHIPICAELTAALTGGTNRGNSEKWISTCRNVERRRKTGEVSGS